jgi:hypothetical protein
MIAKLSRLEVRGFGADDVLRELEHVRRQLQIRNVLKIFALAPHLIGLAQRHAADALAEGL